MWEAWRSNPVSARRSPGDVAYAFDAIRLHNEMTPSSANEVRLRMDGLGLTPKGKRNLRWRIVERKADVLGHPTARTSGNTQRRRLMAIDPYTNGDRPA